MKLKPELLQHPNIPKPLHGVSPRTVKGQDWWDITRQAAYASTDYHCLACGVHKMEAKYHKWLEAHEDYDINYETGEVNIKQIIPLCHSCHNFIHSGRLWMVNRNKNTVKLTDIITHGLDILQSNNLPAQMVSLQLASLLEIKHNCLPLREFPEEDIADWGEWHLVLEGEKYYSKFKNQEQWHDYYTNTL
jgi:hypothetical protein